MVAMITSEQFSRGCHSICNQYSWVSCNSDRRNQNNF